MLELSHDSLVFSFPDVHPHAKASIDFVRTLRIPDDGKNYPLPPGLGAFPTRHIDDFKDRVPGKWRERGGVMLPVFQSEAMWVKFNGFHVPRQGIYPFAIKIAAGKRSAVTGDAWVDGLKEKDYCVIPKQPWIDGYVIDEDTIRQFVAAPLGMGFSAEEQITGKAEFGGIQIEVFPMRREVFEKRFPVIPEEKTHGGIRRRSSMAFGASAASASNYSCNSLNMIGEDADARGMDMLRSVRPDMGLAAGGRMKQTIYEDPFDFADWDTENHARCFVHLANSLAWKAITKHDPPTAPRTAKDYSAHGLPWFEHYDDGKSLQGTDTLKGLKSVLELGFQKGFSVLPENESVELKSDQVVKLGNKAAVRDGSWT